MTTLPPTLVGVLHGDAPEVPDDATPCERTADALARIFDALGFTASRRPMGNGVAVTGGPCEAWVDAEGRVTAVLRHDDIRRHDAVDLDAIDARWKRADDLDAPGPVIESWRDVPALVRELRDARAELARLRADIAQRDQLAAEMRAHVEASIDAAMNAPPCARCGGSGEEPAGETATKRDPDPTVPGAHGERVERRG